MDILHTSYSGLGLHLEALELSKAMLALHQSKLGPEDPERLRSMTSEANSYQALGRHAKALELREATLALRQATLGAEHPDTLLSMHHLGASDHALGRGDPGASRLPPRTVHRRRRVGRSLPCAGPG
jgi:hypothetical protein